MVAAFFVALPWLGCISSIRAVIFDASNVTPMLSICTFGTGVSNLLPVFDVPGFTGPYWGNLVLGMVYLVAAVYAAFTKRSLQVTDFSEFVPPVQTPEINREHALSDA